MNVPAARSAVRASGPVRPEVTSTPDPGPPHAAPGDRSGAAERSSRASGRGCPVCASPLPSPSPAPGAHREVVACPRCGVGVTVPEPARDIHTDGIFEEQYGGGRLAARPQWLKEAGARLDWIGRHCSGGTLLDIGCATGELPYAAAARGFDAVGVEPSEWAAQQAAELGVEVISDISGWTPVFGDRRADVVTLFHVLEHVHAPQELLAGVLEVLAPGGMLFLEVPNFDCSDARRDVVGWVGPAIDDHVLHYTARSLAQVVAAAGFEVVEVTPLPSMVYDSPQVWAVRCHNWLVLGEVAPSENLLRLAARAPIA